MFSFMIVKFFLVREIHDSYSLSKLLLFVADYETDYANSLVSSSSGNKLDPIKAMKAMNPQNTYE